MKHPLLRTVLAGAAVAVAVGSRQALRSTKVESQDVESFRDFLRSSNLNYEEGTEEYKMRLQLFQSSVERIAAINAKNVREGRAWVAGPHPFMDWTVQERQSLHGYKPPRSSGRNSARGSAQLQVRSTAGLNKSSVFADSFTGEGAQHRNQRACGSCWAISAVEAVEAQLRKQGQDVQIGAQALLDCLPNPQHCGGTGGCHGANGELAFGFMQKYGLPLESDLPYTAHTGTCKMGSYESSYPTRKRAVVDGWTNLPSNQAKPFQEALVREGSVVVAVDGSAWVEYSRGVFDGCSKDATLSHAVLAKGFGTDGDQQYWTIQNSWGTQWGENGDIRLLRSTDDDSWCGTDSNPQKGVGCDGGPSEVTVCGMCGLLYDPLVPEGVRIDDNEAVDGLAHTSQVDYTPWRPS